MFKKIGAIEKIGVKSSLHRAAILRHEYSTETGKFFETGETRKRLF